jgi:hypothetical protein
MAAANLRRRFFVDRLIQGRIVGRIAMYWVLYHIVMWHSLFVFRYVQYRAGTLEGKPHQPFGELYGNFVTDYYPLAIFAIITFPIFLFDVIRLTHRVAGPMVRFKNVMQSLLDGDRVPPMKLRPGDLLLPFQDMFNRFTREFQQLRAAPASPAEPPADASDRLTDEQARRVAHLVEPAQEPEVANAK